MRDERGKMKEERVTDYIRRDWETLTVADLLEFLRRKPDGAGDVRSYSLCTKRMEILKKELDRYFLQNRKRRGE